MGATFAFVLGYSSASFIDRWSMSHFQVSWQMVHTSWPVSVADVNSGERGQLVSLMEWLVSGIVRAPGCEPSATWSLGLLLPDFCVISLAVPVTLHICTYSRSVPRPCPLYELKHADCLGHCVIGGQFGSVGSAVDRSELQCCINRLKTHMLLHREYIFSMQVPSHKEKLLFFRYSWLLSF